MIARRLAVAAFLAIGCAADEPLPMVGIWELDTSTSRYLAAEPRRSEMFSCSQRTDRLTCTITSERNDGTVYFGRFEAAIDKARAPVSGMDVTEVEVSFVNNPVLELTFFARGKPAYTYTARRSGDTLLVDLVDVRSEEARASKLVYHRVQRQLPD